MLCNSAAVGLRIVFMWPVKPCLWISVSVIHQQYSGNVHDFHIIITVHKLAKLPDADWGQSASNTARAKTISMQINIQRVREGRWCPISKEEEVNTCRCSNQLSSFFDLTVISGPVGFQTWMNGLMECGGEACQQRIAQLYISAPLSGHSMLQANTVQLSFFTLV